MSVGADLFQARGAVVIAVGSRPAMPPIPGLAEADPWTKTSEGPEPLFTTEIATPSAEWTTNRS